MNPCIACDAPTAAVEDDYGEFICDDCAQNRAESAWERHCEDFHGPSLQEQQRAALRFK